jgi:D-3-phosphoglycerate dehydrogenase
MITGALQQRLEHVVTPVNAERYAAENQVRVHAESTSLKRDFVHLIRVEAVVGGERHFVSGTVLGHRHIRLIEYDDVLLDAIPEGPLLVTWHRDQPGVIGVIGTLLGQQDINISRLQLGGDKVGELALAIWNLSSPITDAGLEQLRADPAMVEAHRVDI